MTNPTDSPIPESLAREIAADAAMLANQVRLMNLVTAVVNPETIFTGAEATAAKYPGFDLPGRDAIHTSGDEAAATLELHAAQLAKRGANGMAYDLRVAAALIRHLDPDRSPQNNLDWNVDHSSDEGLAAFCPACGSSKVKTHPNVWGALHCDECGCYGEARS